MTKAKWTTWEGEDMTDRLEEIKDQCENRDIRFPDIEWLIAEVERLRPAFRPGIMTGMEMAASIAEADPSSAGSGIAAAIRRAATNG